MGTQITDKNFCKHLDKSVLAVYPYGVKYQFMPIYRKIKKNKKNVRNRIFHFTKSARRRMRDYLLRYAVPHMIRCGVTLTLPWKDNYNSLPVDFLRSFYLHEFGEVIHRFRVAWLRRFPRSGAVYRVELQQRKVPHLHIIAYHSSDDLTSLQSEYFRLWFESVGNIRGGDFKGFYLYGVKVDTDLTTARALQYLSDHATKHKQSQLGYQGKQWGIWGRDNFCLTVGRVLHFISDYQFHFFRRHINRFRRFKVDDVPCVFGYKKSRTVNVMQSCQFISKYTMIRLYKHSIRQDFKNTLLMFVWYYVILLSSVKRDTDKI